MSAFTEKLQEYLYTSMFPASFKMGKKFCDYNLYASLDDKIGSNLLLGEMKKNVNGRVAAPFTLRAEIHNGSIGKLVIFRALDKREYFVVIRDNFC